MDIEDIIEKSGDLFREYSGYGYDYSFSTDWEYKFLILGMVFDEICDNPKYIEAD